MASGDATYIARSQETWFWEINSTALLRLDGKPNLEVGKKRRARKPTTEKRPSKRSAA